MPNKQVVGTKTATATKQTEEADGTIVEVITKTITDTYADGSTATRTEVKTIKKSGGGGKGGHKGHGNYIDPNHTPHNSKAPKIPNTTNKAFIKECLEAHNEHRKKHGCPPLQLDDDLGQIAQAWAKVLAKKGVMEHSTTGFGENLYWNTDPPPGRRAADAWYSEIKDHDFKKQFQMGTGHFTQLVWKSTQSIGIAMEVGKKGYFVVANYFPNGNVNGRFEENVPKPKK